MKRLLIFSGFMGGFSGFLYVQMYKDLVDMNTRSVIEREYQLKGNADLAKSIKNLTESFDRLGTSYIEIETKRVSRLVKDG